MCFLLCLSLSLCLLSSYRNAPRSVKELSTQYQPKSLEKKQPLETLKSLLNPINARPDAEVREQDLW